MKYFRLFAFLTFTGIILIFAAANNYSKDVMKNPDDTIKHKKEVKVVKVIKNNSQETTEDSVKVKVIIKNDSTEIINDSDVKDTIIKEFRIFRDTIRDDRNVEIKIDTLVEDIDLSLDGLGDIFDVELDSIFVNMKDSSGNVNMEMEDVNMKVEKTDDGEMVINIKYFDKEKNKWKEMKIKMRGKK